MSRSVDWPAVLSWRDSALARLEGRADRAATTAADYGDDTEVELHALLDALHRLNVVTPPLDAAGHLDSPEGRAITVALKERDVAVLGRVSLPDLRTYLGARIRIDRFVTGSFELFVRSGELRMVLDLIAASIEAQVEGYSHAARSSASPAFEITTWNVRHGGGARRRAIAEVLAGIGSDVVVLPEWRAGGPDPLAAAMVTSGRHVLVPPCSTKDNTNSVLVASRFRLLRGTVTDPELPRRVIHAIVDAHSPVDIIGLYVPSGSGRGAFAAKRAFLGRIIAQIGELVRAGRQVVVAGDLNIDASDDTGRFDNLVGMREFDELLALGLVDAYRAHHSPDSGASWWGPQSGRGYLLDHILIGPGLHPVAASLHEAWGGQRLVGGPSRTVSALSDHALLTASVAFGQ